jgi:hypothetical protein
MIMAMVLVAAFIAFPGLPSALLKAGQNLLQEGGQQSDTLAGFNIYSPLIQNGVANVSYPSSYDVLAAYAVQLVNQDRANYSLGPVVLSPNEAGQQHADSMLKFGYFSHYDTQGFKPYMRYSLLGGTGAVEENVATTSYSVQHYTSLSAVEGSLRLLEYSMMYHDNDSVGCYCNNGHRDNILNPMHNRVSIGIAYDGSTLYFDEDFENHYANLSLSSTSTYSITIQGTLLGNGAVPKTVLMAYDPTPAAETPAQLNAGPREYDAGTIVGGVLPSCSFACPSFSQGITVYASSWDTGGSRLIVSFSLSDFIRQSGPGVYTIYLMTGSDTGTAITSISIFVR